MPDRMRLRAGVGFACVSGMVCLLLCGAGGKQNAPAQKNSVQGQEILWCHLACRARVFPGGSGRSAGCGQPRPGNGGQPAADTGPNAVPRALRDPLCRAACRPVPSCGGLSVGAARGFTFASTVSEKIIALPRRLVKRAGGRGVIPPLPPARGRSSTARRW